MVDKSVRKDIDSGLFNSEQFFYRIDSMLNLVQEIQIGNISQDSASQMIGKALANDYVDACKQPGSSASLDR
jgi:hypothetical protein